MDVKNNYNAAIFEFVKNIPLNSNQNLRLFAELYGTNDLLHTLVQYKALKASQVKPILFTSKDKGALKEYRELNGKCKSTKELKELKKIKSEAIEEIELEDINGLSPENLIRAKRLITNPNEYERFSDFIYSLCAYQDLAGFSLIYKQQVTAKGQRYTARAYSVPTDRVIIEGGTPYDPIKGYHFDGYYKKTFDAADCVRLGTFSTNHNRMGQHLYGTSRVHVAYQRLQTYISANNREYTSFETGDSAHLLFPKSLEGQVEAMHDETIWQKMKEQIRRALFQRDETSTAFIPQELGHINLASTIRDSITIEAKQEIKEMLASIWMLPSRVVFNDNTSSTYNNLIEDRKRALYDGVFPFLNQLEETYIELIKELGYNLSFDYQAYQELAVDNVSEMVELAKVPFLTDNEKRDWFNYDKMEGGDELAGNNSINPINFDYASGDTTA